MSDPFNEQNRYGSAAFTDEDQLRKAGLLSGSGLQLGYWKNKPIRLDDDAPIITIGGAGSGKLRDVLSYVVCRSPGQRALILDPRGELGAISIHIHASYGDHAYFWNPMRLCGLPVHGCNPLDILKLSSPTFHADCKFIAESLVAMTGSDSGKYFEERARSWIEALLKSIVEAQGEVSLVDLHWVVSIIESDPQNWATHLEVMLASDIPSVRRTASEMLTKQQDSPREFGSIMGTVYASLNFLDDPTLLTSLDHSDFSLEELTDPNRASKIFLNIPAEYLSIWSPLIRLFFTVTMLYKSRAPEAPRILLLVDEAGQLGRFETLLRAFSYGRGMGIRAWAVFQDTGQIVRNFGAAALQGFLGSAQTRQFFGVRDYQTAKLISDMLGTETLEYDDEQRQDEARRRKRETVRNLFLEDADPFKAAREYQHHERDEERKTKQSRPLMTPSEILDMPEDRQILFISGKGLPPIYGWKYPYYQRREMAGLYLPNPYHPPIKKCRIKTLLGSRWVPVITEAAPERFASFPQHQDGSWSYLKGYKPG